MNELELRQSVVDVMRGWFGAVQGDPVHAEILSIYNGHRPLARSYKVKPTDSWCAACASAAFIKANLGDIIGTECGCGEMVAKAQKMGIWQEFDGYTPNIGDLILYDWDDSGKGDNTGWPDHVGIVEKVSGNAITVIEGNMGGKVGHREIAVNGRYIRGFICPKYSTKADKEPPKVYAKATTSLYLRIGPNRTYGLCGIDRRDGRGRRYALVKDEVVEVAGRDKTSGWYQLRVVCGSDVLWPWASDKYLTLI